MDYKPYRTSETAVNEENENTMKYYKQEYEDLKKTNPFKTDEAKAILGKYDLAALQGRDNAVASGGASNGGNIDSYAAANALRQQSALINQGQMAVLDAHQRKIDNVRGLLSDMGVNIDRVFNQDQTAKNNEVARLSEQASVTGYVPSEWVIKNSDTYSQFLNPDGSFKKEKENVDIQALIDAAKSRNDMKTVNELSVVRARKILGNYGEFGKYIKEGDISFMGNQQTEAGRVTDIEAGLKKHEIDTSAEVAKETLTSEKEINDANNQNKLDVVNAETQGNITLMDKQNELSGDTKALSEDSIKRIDTFAEALNKVFKTHKSNPNGIEIISNEGNGSLKLNIPEGTKESWWRDPIMYRIMDSNAITEDEKNTIIISLGWNDKDIIEMYDTYPELDK